MNAPSEIPVPFIFSDSAASKVAQLIDEEGNPDLKLRVFVTGGGRTLYAIDARSGATLWQYDLGQQGYANPMTYRGRDGKQYVVIATGGGSTSKLMAFAF